jgi:deoxyribonuclease-4
MKKDDEEVYQQIKKEIKEIVNKLKDENNQIQIRPETTGKGTQWGSVQEIVKMSQEVEGVWPCIDFSHLCARSVGKINTYEEFKKVLGLVEKSLGKKGLEEMHIHVSGIEYGERGEKWHLELGQSDFKWKELLKALKEFGCKGVVISESPNIEKDALLMQKEYNKI